MMKKSRVSNKGQLIRARRCRRGQAMDFRVALTSAIAADCACNGFEFQRSLSQHLHWYFPNLGGHTAGCSPRFLFADPSISSPANSDYTNERLTSSPSALGTGSLPDLTSKHNKSKTCCDSSLPAVPGARSVDYMFGLPDTLVYPLWPCQVSLQSNHHET